MKIKELPSTEYIIPGTGACAGCPLTTGLRIIGKALGENAIGFLTPSCAVASMGLTPQTCYTFSALNICFASAGASAGGAAMALDALYRKGKLKGEKPVVFNWVGDGGTYDIGFQGLSASAERNDDFLHFCYNNEAYSNTGNQRSGATPQYALTTTSPLGKEMGQKNVPLIMLEHRPPYVATASLAYPMDLYRKVEKARKITGFRYIEIHMPCCTSWRFPPADTIRMSKLAVKTGSWLLWEGEYGKLTLNGVTASLAEGKRKPSPVESYLKPQGRFSTLFKSSEKEQQLAQIEANIGRELEFMVGRAKL
ncbi:thiamine pyrophosphate-dependent enzyme [Candidatus Contubernalis alkaliaceticus]|uniref:thiamine pyrophosphate-dependent enzyme n=1 Tax=Candidatus Contubernalis alkaliaceticus TaxID=338645 RepID=UPI001F4BF909|nr:thiamine pyrophosphate-dependent enzyme [Candidatus Contubernalis alkalaceticus]UNC91025.1 pyruvate synthase subunit beta [Candidatus Contubernalis alkalaceticus]